MLKPKSELDSFLNEYTKKRDFKVLSDLVVDYVYNKHKIPKGEISDYLSGRKNWSEADEVTEYCVIEALANQDQPKKKEEFNERINAYYTKIEKGKYAKWKHQTDEIEFPFVIPCYQVADDQWIGYTTMRTLLKLGDASLIRYNENAQRVMRKKLNGKKEEFIPSVNHRAVKAIIQSYKEGIYIPNTITLNIPEDVDTVFKYDSEMHQMIFKSISVLDITDGYHRYLAGRKTYADDKEFDTPIELRITQFSDEKARSFIYQEDQKTKMTRVESKSMNTNDPANIITEKLNSSSTSNFKGLILRVGGIIKFANLAHCIRDYYLKDKKDLSRMDIINEYKIIEDFLNLLSDNDTSLLDNEWTYNYTLAAILILKYMQEQTKLPKEGLTYKEVDLNKMVSALSSDNAMKLTPNKNISTPMLNEIDGKIKKLVKKRG